MGELSKKELEAAGEAIIQKMKKKSRARNARKNQRARANRAYHKFMGNGFQSAKDFE